MGSAELQQYITEQASSLFPEGLYEASRTAIPRCGLILVPRFTVRHLAERLRGMQSVEELRTFTRDEATRSDHILIAWAFQRIAETVGPGVDEVCLPLHIGPERLLRMDALHLCQLGFWLHLIVWPESYCPASRSNDCGNCDLQPPR